MISYIKHICQHYHFFVLVPAFRALKTCWRTAPRLQRYKEFKERQVWIAAARAAKHERNLQLHAYYAKHFWSNPIQLRKTQ